MLRITTFSMPTEVRLVLEGKLTGPWVEELQSAWEKSLSQYRSRKCVVDLSGTTAIDENGKRLLTAMHSKGVRFIANGVATIQLIKEIRCKCAQQFIGETWKRG